MKLIFCFALIYDRIRALGFRIQCNEHDRVMIQKGAIMVTGTTGGTTTGGGGGGLLTATLMQQQQRLM